LGLGVLPGFGPEHLRRPGLVVLAEAAAQQVHERKRLSSLLPGSCHATGMLRKAGGLGLPLFLCRVTEGLSWRIKIDTLGNRPLRYHYAGTPFTRGTPSFGEDAARLHPARRAAHRPGLDRYRLAAIQPVRQVA